MARVSGVSSGAGGHVVLVSSDVQGGTATGHTCCRSGRSNHVAFSSSSGFRTRRRNQNCLQSNNYER
uniref:Uncharacterized protein n=1 Tax=Triticum urartu TaxID=4572 RepID=A0A8R7U878_TRIUA